MKENFFPNRIIEIAGLLLMSLLLAMPYFFFIDIHFLYETNKVLFLLSVCSIFIGISMFVNIRRKQKIKWNFKIIDFRYLYLMLTIILIFKIGINIPVDNLIGNSELSNPFINLSHVLGVIIIAPILEELIFRVIILRGLLTIYRPKYAIVISAIIFGLIHVDPLLMWHAFLIGLFLGWIYYNTKSIGTVILLHSFSNFSVLGYKYMIYQFSDTYSISSANILLIITSVPLLYIVVRKLALKITTFKSETIIDALHEIPLPPPY
jgi:membrane protease YdiL (CAAX protease family)